MPTPRSNGPALSIGLAIRNGRESVGRCIESVLSQDFADLELVVSDNASDDGTVETVEEYAGEFPTSPDPARRFERMLWFFQAGDAKYDPIYALYRRDRLMRSHRIRPFERTDWLLSAELALMGPIVHVYERLAHRTRDYPVGSQRVALRRRLDPVRANTLPTTPQRLSRELFALAVAADLSEQQLRRCRRALLPFWAKEAARVSRARAADVKHQLLAC